MIKRLSLLLVVAVSVAVIGITRPASVQAAACSEYSSNGYFGGSWFFFSSNSIVSNMISTRELERIFTTDSTGSSAAIPDGQFALGCVAPSFNVQTSGTSGLFIRGSGWSNAGFSYHDLVSLTNAYLSSRFIYPTTTVFTSTTTTLSPATTSTTIPLAYCAVFITSNNPDFVLTFSSLSTRPTNPEYTAYSSVTWSFMTHLLRIAAGPVYIPVSRGTSCSQFDSYPSATTSTVSPYISVPQYSSTSTIQHKTSNPSATTSTVSSYVSVPQYSSTSTLQNKSNNPSADLVKDSTSSVTTTTVPASTCVPSTDNLYIYSYFGMGQVTNHGGKYDAGSNGSAYDYSRKCKVARATELRIEDKSGVKSQASLSMILNFDQNISNCWRISRVSQYGQSEWSNLVCYTAPAKKVSTVVSKVKSSVPRGVKGAQCLDGYRTIVRTKKACSGHFGRDFWLYKPFKAGYSFNYAPSRSTANVGFGTGNKCVGICYGVPSAINSLPRNTYVSGYFRKDGAYVGPYTKSSR